MTAATPKIERVSEKIKRFRAESKSAFAELLALFYPRQVRQAKAALGNRRPGLRDEEDVALSAFHSLWREGIAGHFDGRMDNTNGLLSVLQFLTFQKARKARRFEQQEKRDVTRLRVPDHLAELCPDPRGAAGPDPLADLPPSLSPRQRQIARMRYEGWVRAEIAKRLGCSVRAVDRELADMRCVIRDHLTESPSSNNSCQIPPVFGQ